MTTTEAPRGYKVQFGGVLVAGEAAVMDDGRWLSDGLGGYPNAERKGMAHVFPSRGAALAAGRAAVLVDGWRGVFVVVAL